MAAPLRYFGSLHPLPEWAQNGYWIVPAQLTIFCFHELRLEAELHFCCCTTPGYSHLRTAIEPFVQAQKIRNAFAAYCR